MEVRNYALCIILEVLLVSTASAKTRGINTDGWEFNSNGTGNTVTVAASSALPDGSTVPGGVSLAFAPGNSVGNYTVLSKGSGYDMYDWLSPSFAIEEQVIYQTTGANTFTVDMNYADVSCTGEIGKLTVGGLSYTANSPCTFGVEESGTSSSGNQYDYFDSHFSFMVTASGQVQLIGQSPWTTGTVAAPELDDKSFLTALTLLAGTLVVMGGRKRLS